jgi:hypothetical protein
MKAAQIAITLFCKLQLKQAEPSSQFFYQISRGVLWFYNVIFRLLMLLARRGSG